MGKAKKVLDESCLILGNAPHLIDSQQEHPRIIDTHTHILSTYQSYIKAFPQRENYPTIQDFAQKVIRDQGISGLVDVWCEVPVSHGFQDVLESLKNIENFAYNFVIGVHPHQAKDYTEAVEEDIAKAHQHPLCVGWGEMGLDYHYDNSPREIQQRVFKSQIKRALASGLGKALTIHTREADEDCWNILHELVPKEQKIHVHCFTDAPEFAKKMLDHFPNLFIGITGVATYSSNQNTSNVIRMLASTSVSPSENEDGRLRLLLETDAPYMTPSSLQKKRKLPFCHSGMIPWVAEYVAQVLNEGKQENERKWTTRDVLDVCARNAKTVYGV